MNGVHTQERRELVDSAARWLDETYPGWAATIDVENFEIEDPQKCVGHYLDVDWYEDLCIPFKAATGNPTGVFADEKLQEYWVEEIERRS